MGYLVVFGVTYWVAMVVAIAWVASLIAVPLLILIGLMAVYAWAKNLRRSVIERDRDWTGDLIAAPLAGLIAALVVGSVYHPILTWFNHLDDKVNGGHASWFYFVGPVAFVVFVVCLVGTAKALASRERPVRRWAYPGFAVYGAYAGLIAIAIRRGQFN